MAALSAPSRPVSGSQAAARTGFRQRGWANARPRQIRSALSSVADLNQAQRSITTAAMELAVAILADQRQWRTLGLTAVVIVRGGEYGDAAVRAVAAGRCAKAPGRAAWDRKIDPVADPIGGNRVGIADAGALAGGDDACVFLQPLGLDDAEELAGADRRRGGQGMMPVAGIGPDLGCARF